MSKLILILGDQLSHQISSLQHIDKRHDTIVMCEVWEEATYVKHHKKKIAFLFSAMRHFARELETKGYRVRYITLDDPDNSGTFSGEITRAATALNADTIIVTHPGEYRVLKMIESWQQQCDISVEIRDDNRFLCSLDAFKAWAEDKTQLRMEFFYREMRTRHAILMEDDTPIGGKWNYDADNRTPPKKGLDIPPPYHAQIDTITRDVLALVEERFREHFGELEPFYFAVTRDQALYCLKKFIDERLPYFGTYQDAMLQDEPWMYHSHISFYLNCGLLEPRECIEKAVENHAPLNAVEGFIRQILGWREYVRGIYWLNMPDYADANALDATRKLPAFYWTNDTHMNCMKQCIHETMHP